MKYLKRYENYSDLEKEEQERAKETELSNSPHLQKQKAEEKRKREEKSYKEDPDGMYPRDSERYDDTQKSGWQDGMGKPPWLGESIESDFDIDFAMAKIREHFPEDTVIDKFDNEVMEWVDSDWADDYDSEYDWYIDHNNGEAQDVVINELINWFTSEYKKPLDMDQHSDLHNAIKQEYDCLNYH